MFITFLFLQHTVGNNSSVSKDQGCKKESNMTVLVNNGTNTYNRFHPKVVLK